MNSETRASHWDRVYDEKQPTEVSWYQTTPELSMRLIRASRTAMDDLIVDVGGGASTLVDALLTRGYGKVAVLDISEKALGQSRSRLGEASERVRWISVDILDLKTDEPIALWHDRAVFHFLTEESDRIRYVDALKRNLAPGGAVVVATFASDGPEECSGLPVERYNAAKLAEVLGSDFRILEHECERHVTPWGSEQSFQYTLFRYMPMFAI